MKQLFHGPAVPPSPDGVQDQHREEAGPLLPGFPQRGSRNLGEGHQEGHRLSAGREEVRPQVHPTLHPTARHGQFEVSSQNMIPNELLVSFNLISGRRDPPLCGPSQGFFLDDEEFFLPLWGFGLVINI